MKINFLSILIVPVLFMGCVSTEPGLVKTDDAKYYPLNADDYFFKSVQINNFSLEMWYTTAPEALFVSAPFAKIAFVLEDEFGMFFSRDEIAEVLSRAKRIERKTPEGIQISKLEAKDEDDKNPGLYIKITFYGLIKDKILVICTVIIRDLIVVSVADKLPINNGTMQYSDVYAFYKKIPEELKNKIEEVRKKAGDY